jgi:FkbM family methyltransferase
VEWVKWGRRYMYHHGYDFHPVDRRCWEDQIALLHGRNVEVVFDIGANVGDIAAQYREMYPNSRLFCFEPQETHFLSLTNRFQGDPHISFHRAAIGTVPGKARLHLTASRDSSSLLGVAPERLPPVYRKSLAVEAEQEVEVIALDKFAKQHNLDRIDICKMDIQGGEYAALEGARELLSAARIPLLYLEVCFIPLYMNHPLLGDIAKYLARYDYTLHFLYNMVINGQTGKLLWSDAIFVSPELYEISREQLSRNWGNNQS